MPCDFAESILCAHASIGHAPTSYKVRMFHGSTYNDCVDTTVMTLKKTLCSGVGGGGISRNMQLCFLQQARDCKR